MNNYISLILLIFLGGFALYILYINWINKFQSETPYVKDENDNPFDFSKGLKVYFKQFRTKWKEFCSYGRPDNKCTDWDIFFGVLIGVLAILSSIVYHFLWA